MFRVPAGLLAVLLLALVARMAACWVWSDDLTRDRDVYLGIAQQVAAGQGFCTPGTAQPTAYRPPLYPLLLALPLLAFPAALATTIVNIIAGLVTVLATWAMARQCGLSERRAMFAAALVALDPLLVRYTAQPMTECVFTALTTSALWALAESRERKRPAAWIFATGTLLGLAALCRPTIWPFVAAVSAWMIVDVRKTERPRLRFGLVLLWLGVAFATAPWAIRNTVVLGKPIVTTTHGGYTLLLANNPVFYKVARQPWGAVWDGESLERWQRDMLDRAADDLGPHAGEIALDRWQSAQARQNIRRDPSGFLAATAYRVLSFWSLVPRGDSTKTAMGIASGVWYAVLFAGAVWGCWSQFRRDVRWLAVLILLIASIQAVHLVYWTDTRMRAPLHPIFALFCAGVGCSPLRTSTVHKTGDSR